jgi:hypothetical protein
MPRISEEDAEGVTAKASGALLAGYAEEKEEGAAAAGARRALRLERRADLAETLGMSA